MLRLLAIAGFTSSAVPLDAVDDFVKDSTLDEGIAAYQALLETASSYYMNSGLQVTPEDVLKSRLAYRLKAQGVKWDGKLSSLSGDSFADVLKNSGQSQAGTYTTTTKSVDFMNPKDAKGLVQQTLQQQLGRDPTQAEYEDFLAAIHAAEKDDPSTTTTTYTLDDQGRQTDSSTVTHQGIGATGLAQMAQEKAQRQPGWAEWQAMGTYAPALFAALGSTVPGS
jgi:hypothetical protein